MRGFLKILDSRGLTMVELVVATGIAGFIALGGTKIIQMLEANKANFSTRMNGQTLSKMIETTLNSKNGCQALIGTEVDDEFSVKMGNTLIEKDVTFSGVKVESLRIDKFLPTDKTGLAGVADVKLVLSNKLSNYPSVSKIFLLVTVELTPDYNLKVVGCNEGRQESINLIVDRLCGGAFGESTPGLNCAQVIQYLQLVTNRSICQDVYGDKARMKFSNLECDLKDLHAGKTCPPGHVLKGFDTQGEMECIPAGTCGRWSDFEPDARTQCPSEQVMQKRTCLDPTYEGPEVSRIVPGTKFDCQRESKCRAPGSWQGKNGVHCLSEEVVESFLAPEEKPQTLKGIYPTYELNGQTFHNVGQITFFCKKNAPIIVNSECSPRPGSAP